MIYYLHYHEQEPPQKFDEHAARLLIDNSHKDEQRRVELCEDLQAGEKVYIRPGYLRRGDLN
jgi:hypothetical protein